MKRTSAAGFCLLAVCALVAACRGRTPPAPLAEGLSAADGLEATLFAAEPDLVNPTAIDVDSRGRVWVTEAVNYRGFKNPFTRLEGDRIRVLEDTDGDGRCDRATTFYQDPALQAPLGIAVLGSRVYVCQSPELFYLEDTDNDGRADRKTVVLTGFKGVDHDHAIHGVTLGPDGLLYFSVGDQGLDVEDKRGNRIQVGRDAPHHAASVLRTDMEGGRLELLAENLRNPYEPAVDSFGNVFISDNDDDGNEQCRIVHVMRGGNYGYWPRRRGDRRLDEVHWNEDLPGVIPKILKTGFGSPAGMIFYEGDLLPERYRSTLVHADAGPGVIRSYSLQPKGASYSAGMETMLSSPEDQWFRPIDVASAPDGSIFVADWYDPGVGGHNIGDFKRGRIYRLAPPGGRYRIPGYDYATAAGAAEALRSPNQAVRFLAQQGLTRMDAAAVMGELERSRAGGDALLEARLLWLLGAHAEMGAAEALRYARDARPDFRVAALRILARQGPEQLRSAQFAADDDEPAVRRELLLLLQHVNENWSRDLVRKLIDRFDGEDRYYREAIGIAVRGREQGFFADLAARSGGSWDSRLAALALQLRTPHAVELATRVFRDSDRADTDRRAALRVVAAAGGDGAAGVMIAELRPNTPAVISLEVLQLLGRDEGGAWPAARSDRRLHRFLAQALGDPELRDRAHELIRDMKLTVFVPQLLATAANQGSPKTLRLSALETLRQLRVQSGLAPLAKLLQEPDRDVATASARAVAAVPGDHAQQLLSGVMLDSSRELGLRREIVRLLGSSRPGSALLLQIAGEGRLSKDLVAEATEVTHSSANEAIRLMAAEVLPRQRRDGNLPPVDVLLQMKGDAERGRMVFFVDEGPQCARCHRISGVGREVGPDLTRVGAKLAPEAILQSILDPAAAVSHEYQVWLVRTKSRGYLDGYIRAEQADAIDLVDANGATSRIPVSDILSRTRSTASLMPSGLTSGMSTEQLVDLVAYLATLR